VQHKFILLSSYNIQYSTTNCTATTIMLVSHWKKLAFYYTLILLSAAVASTGAQAAKANNNNKAPVEGGVLNSLHKQYDELSPKGKMATGAAIGFIGSRLALSTVTKVIKIGAGAFIAYVHHLFACARICVRAICATRGILLVEGTIYFLVTILSRSHHPAPLRWIDCITHPLPHAEPRR
jgi:hypothetical protein